MKTLEFKLQAEDVKISSEEILADLSYPAPAVRPPADRGSVRAQRRARR